MDGVRIRNFVIIAHIDHGKSTLADRFLELTGAIERRKMRGQYLDMNPLEREKGITIKMQPVRMMWKPKHAEILNPKSETLNESKIQNPNVQNDRLEFRISDLGFADSKHEYVLNLIDTPGHADFSYEVSRSLAAVEGAILLVDATQGVQAQTLANLALAQEEGLAIIPVINKIDLPSADVPKAEEELCTTLGVARGDIIKVSAKDGTGVAELLAAVVEKVPSPKEKFKDLNIEIFKQGYERAPLRALVFDSKYDPYLGVVAHVRIMDGAVQSGDRILCMASEAAAEALEIGVFTPERSPVGVLRAGEIGYIATGIKEPSRVRVGDTITDANIFKYLNIETFKSFALPGYRESAPVVFASVYPEDQDDFERLRVALGKLRLEDAALTYEPEDAGALGRGFRAGFLGLLHMEIVAERLRREYDLALALSRPSVAFRVKTQTRADGTRTHADRQAQTDGEHAYKMVYAASRMPDAHEIAELQEPWVLLDVVTPTRFLGGITSLVTASEGLITKTETLTGDRLRVEADMPLRTVITDFYDRLKSVSEGFASFAYAPAGWRAADLVRLDIAVAGETSPALAEVVSRARAYDIGKKRTAALKELLPRQLFAVALQASVDGRIIARETMPALKKDVTGYMYGGDRTRKMKLWKKQQRGKKRMASTGRVTIPPDVFFKLHKTD